MHDSASKMVGSGVRMTLPRLNIPSQDVGQRPKPYYRPRQLEQWAAELAIGNTTVAAHQMLEQLRSLNRACYPARERLRLHNALRPVFSELLHALRQSLRQASIPLDYKNQYNASLVQQLYEEMAIGYKLIVSEFALTAKLKELENLLMQEAAYLSIVYLSHRLVEAYSLYQPEPVHVWSDLNQLYLFAETRQFHLNTIDDPLPDTTLAIYPTIDFAYKRIVLLALAEPYHLMQYEADDLFRLVAASVPSCQIENYNDIVTSGEYIIDLHADAGPRFIAQDQEWRAASPRLVDITQVKSQLNTHLQRLLRSSSQYAQLEAVSLVERQQRDMLLRLADAWSASLVRKSNRFNLDAEVELTPGLNACHHYISNSSMFTPEMDELKLTVDKTDPGVDVHTVFATAYREALQKDRRHAFQQYQLNPWWQRNVSPIGIALDYNHPDAGLDIRVGELVAYRFANRKKRRWNIGVIRWLQHENTDSQKASIHTGIMNLANGAIAVGTKAIKGLGSGTDYFRALMIPKQISIEQTRSIIVPALLYDVGSVLTINMRQRLFHVRLSRMMLSTRSFSQFEFEVIEKLVHL